MRYPIYIASDYQIVFIYLITNNYDNYDNYKIPLIHSYQFALKRFKFHTTKKGIKSTLLIAKQNRIYGNIQKETG